MGGTVLWTRTDEIREQGRSEGITEGRTEGIKEGIKEGTVLSILKMLKKGTSADTIAMLFDIEMSVVQKAEQFLRKYADKPTVQGAWDSAASADKKALLALL